MLDDERRDRLRRAGDRFRETGRQRNSAVSELKAALAEADGDSNPEEAAHLTGLSDAESEVFLGGDWPADPPSQP